jgi:hypothetical protein
MATRISLAPLCALVLLTLCVAPNSFAQRRGGPPPGPPPPAKAAAPIDITGYWVALVTEDWRYRMTVPPKGDYSGVPLNAEGKKAADAWDPASDEAAGEQCRAYGAAGIMRIPTRLHITWQDDETLKVETDAGTQTRILHFKPSDAQAGTWQGVSLASWDRDPSLMGFGRGGPHPGGTLKVVTTKMKPGYLRRNGVPYSANTVLTEYWDRLDAPSGESLLVVASEVVDPANLNTPYWTSIHFRKQNDASGWNPTPCSVK